MAKLKSFIQFVNESKPGLLNEATFNIKDAQQVADLLAKIASKRTGADFKRLTMLPGLDTDTVDFTKADGTTGTGYMYVNKNGERLRIGMAQPKEMKKSQFELNSIDFWDKSNTDFFGQPTRSAVAQPNMNIVNVVKSMLDYVITGQLPVLAESKIESLSRSNRLIVEGVDANDPRLENPYVKYAVEVLGADIEIFKTGVAPGMWREYAKKVPGFKMDEFKEWQAGFKAVANKETNTMSAGAKKVDAELAKVKYADINYVFDDIEKLAVLVGTKAANSLIITGAQGGTGKSFTVVNALTKLLGSPDGPEAKWRYFKGGKTSPLGLYTTLFINRDEVIVFDDSDSIFQSEDTVNMLKSALDTSEPRKVSWNSGATQNVLKLTDSEKRELYNKIDDAYMDDPSSVGSKDLKLPSEFNFKGAVIVITNIPKDKLNQPILSRSYVVDVTLRREDLMLRIKTILKAKNVVDDTTADTIMERLEQSGGQVTMRAVETAVTLIKAGISDWERLVQNYVAS
jgi:hypothetical protein